MICVCPELHFSRGGVTKLSYFFSVRWDGYIHICMYLCTFISKLVEWLRGALIRRLQLHFQVADSNDRKDIRPLLYTYIRVPSYMCSDMSWKMIHKTRFGQGAAAPRMDAFCLLFSASEPFCFMPPPMGLLLLACGSLFRSFFEYNFV